jgi:hypothetical protein
VSHLKRRHRPRRLCSTGQKKATNVIYPLVASTISRVDFTFKNRCLENFAHLRRTPGILVPQFPVMLQAMDAVTYCKV